MRINDCSFKYVCVVCCLKICFYCLTFSAILNLNSADFTTSKQLSEILILKIEMLLEFQNKRNSEIIEFLELSDIDLRNIDLLDTHLDLLDTDIPSKNFVCLHSVFKTSSRYNFKTSSRHFFKTSSGHVFKTSSRHVSKTSSRHIFKTSSRRLQRNNFLSSKTSWRRLARCLQDVSEDVKLLR